jgi:hypothetical protein
MIMNHANTVEHHFRAFNTTRTELIQRDTLLDLLRRMKAPLDPLEDTDSVWLNATFQCMRLSVR